MEKQIEVCQRCKGAGEITYDMPAISETWRCPECKGEGLIYPVETEHKFSEF